MIDIAVELLAGYFEDEASGINAMTQSLPRAKRRGGEHAAPPVVPIFNDAEHKGVATAMMPKELPAIVVWGDSARLVAKDTRSETHEVVIAVAYMTKDSADDLTQNRVCGLLMRGTRRSVRRYRSQAKSEAYRTLNGVSIETVEAGDEQRITMAGEGDTPVIWGWLAIHARVVDGIQ